MNWFDWLIAVLLGLSVFAWFYWRTGLALLWTVLIALGAFGVGLFGSFWIRTALAAAMAATPSAGVNNAPQQSGQAQSPTTQAQMNGCATVPDFGQYVGKPYDLIAKLDSQAAKVPQPNSSFTINASEGCVLYWTGAYVGNLPTGFEPLFVDGRTGVFLVRTGQVTVNFVGAMMPLAKFDPNATVQQVAGDQPTGCMPTDQLVSQLNANHTTDPDKTFRELDRLANVEGAPFLAARLRPTPDGPHTYQAKTGTYIWWVQTGKISGAEGTDWVKLEETGGKTLYLAAKDEPIEIQWAHAGAVLCTGMHPDQSLNYWGR